MDTGHRKSEIKLDLKLKWLNREDLKNVKKISQT